MTAQEAMAELWGGLCPDCGPDDYAGILAELKRHLPAVHASQGREAQEKGWLPPQDAGTAGGG